ncbi:Terminase [Gammaproteobacteria bacterium]
MAAKQTRKASTAKPTARTKRTVERVLARIGPQEGPQEAFLSSSADIVLYGGQAGGGKSWGILLEGLRHAPTNRRFSAVYFRRNTTQIRNPGGLWDESVELYTRAGGVPIESSLLWKWPKGGKIKFAHLEHEKTVHDWQGSQIPLICFDELTHFTRKQFFYMLSRNRGMSGVDGYIRATCNPDADSWVAEFIAWWIDPETGFSIPERSGVIRWFIVLNDAVIWAASREELVELYEVPGCEEEDRILPKSFTFISASVYDNKKLLKSNPGYLANLKALPLVDQARLLGGNWKIRPAAGLYFRREWCEIVDVAPADLDVVRYWDLASTEKTDSNDPDWTIGVKMGRHRTTGLYYVLHVVRLRANPAATETAWKNTASSDGPGVRIGFPQDPGQAGKSQAAYIVKQLSGYTVTTRPEGGSKIVRFGPFSAQAQAGNIKILRGAWNEDYFASMEGFPDATHDDDADGSSGAFAMHTGENMGLFDFYEQQYNELMAKKAAAA